MSKDRQAVKRKGLKYLGLRERKKNLKKQIKEINQQMELLEGELFKLLGEKNLVSMKTEEVTVSIKKQPVPVLEDWDKYFKYAKRKGNEDLIQKSVPSRAWRERYDDGKKVPGTSSFQRVSLSVTKRRSNK